MSQVQVATTYDNSSISALKGADRVRLRPAVIFGSDDIVGAQHSFFEILSNSIDEAREGYGKVIRTKRYKDGSLEVEDHGRGIPLDYNEVEKRYNWELVYCELYAGGKYNNAEGEHYEYSLGLNGLGACATQYASRYFEVKVVRDGYEFELAFERGENVGGLKKTKTKQKQTGTLQRWKPDSDVFTEIDIPQSYFLEILKQQAVVNAGVTFIFEDEKSGEEFSYVYPDGIEGYARELNDGQGITDVIYRETEGKGRDREDRDDYRVKVELAFAFTNHAPRQEYFHNSSYLEYGGSPDRAVRRSFTSAIDKMIRHQDKYKTKESKISFTDIEDSLLIVISSFSTRTSYENQTKKAINNQFIERFLADDLRTSLELWAIENSELAEKVVDQVLANKRSREQAERQRKTLRKTLMTNVDNLNNRVKKFVDCRSKDVTKRELYIVEGDSALGSVKLGRDAEFQAVIPIRGKILNCLKSSLSQILKNEIIMDLVKVLGCGMEIEGKGGKETFDLDQLRWSKVIICTDADVDGFQIRTLVLTMFYRLMPTLIRENKIYIAESPLYEVTHRKGRDRTTYFAYDEREKNELIAAFGADSLHLQRSKGLGENDPDMMWYTTMNPETRRLIEVQVEDEESMATMFDLLLGDNLAGRKSYIEEHGEEFIELLDIG